MTLAVAPARFSELRALLGDLPEADQPSTGACREREVQLTKPAGALGRLEEISAWLCAWQGRHPPRLEKTRICIFAANHGIAARGVSAYPPEVTAQMVMNFRAKGAAINQIAAMVGAGVRIVDVGVEQPTADLSERPAMSEAAFFEAFRAGWESVDGDLDLVVPGEMGIGNTTTAAALACAVLGGKPEEWVGAGTGVDEAGLARKAAVIAQALQVHGDILDDPLASMAVIGGKELAAIAGMVLSARFRKLPVILDGFISAAAVAPLVRVAPSVLDHCQIGHRSAEQAHGRLVDALGIGAPLLDLGMRLGEGSGGALALSIVKAAVACHNGMATFASASVSAAVD